VQGRPLISTMQAMGCNRQSSMACRILRSAKQNQLKNHFDRAPRRDSKVNPVVKKQKRKASNREPADLTQTRDGPSFWRFLLLLMVICATCHDPYRTLTIDICLPLNGTREKATTSRGCRSMCAKDYRDPLVAGLVCCALINMAVKTCTSSTGSDRAATIVMS